MFGNPGKAVNFSIFRSADVAQRFLLQCYKQQQREDAVQRSYTNCYPFLYYLEHGQNFYAAARQSPLSIKPVLLFYGMVQLIKACLLTVDPDYPESTSVLAHGVSTRKRKKQGYEFLDDEVKIQKNGLFTHFSEKNVSCETRGGGKISHGHAVATNLRTARNIFLFKRAKKAIVVAGRTYGFTAHAGHSEGDFGPLPYVAAPLHPVHERGRARKTADIRQGGRGISLFQDGIAAIAD